MNLGRRTASRAAGLNETFIRDLVENPGRSPRAENLAALAAVLGVSVQWLLTGEGELAQGATTSGDSLSFMQTRSLLVRGVVAAGLWREAWDEADGVDPDDIERVHVPTPSGFERASLYALRVRGRSMDLEYPDGSIIIVCPIGEIELRAHDHVVVLRRRSGLTEATVKELVQLRDGGWALQARSTDPSFAAPWPFDPDAGVDEIEITAVVVGSYRTRSRPAQMQTKKSKQHR